MTTRSAWVVASPLIVAILVAACGGSGPAPSTVLPNSSAPVGEDDLVIAKTIPPPDGGMASLCATLYSPTTYLPIPRTLFYLTPAVGPARNSLPLVLTGPDPSRGDIQGYTNDLSQLCVVDALPGSYFLAVWAPPYSWSIAVTSKTDMSPLLLGLEPNQQTSMGILYVPWP
jgi:hypothetical protein